jgi:hypothetical protein
MRLVHDIRGVNHMFTAAGGVYLRFEPGGGGFDGLLQI